MAETVAIAFPAMAAPWPRALLLMAFFGTLSAVNVAGAKEGARMAVALTITKLVPLAALVLWSLPHFQMVAITGGGLPPLAKLGEASLLLFFAFTGAESALAPSGEIKNVRRDIPRGIMMGAAGIIVIYLCVHVAAQSVLGDALAKEGSAPLAAAAAVVMGPFGRTLLLAGAVISMVGAVGGDLLSTPRSLFATAVDGHLPAVFARVHPRFHTPWVAIVTYGGLACFFAIIGGFKALAALASAGLLLVYFGICLAVLRERKRAAPGAEGFRIPGGPLVPVLGMVLVVGLLSNAQRSEWAPLGGLVGVSAAYYAARRMIARKGAAA